MANAQVTRSVPTDKPSAQEIAEAEADAAQARLTDATRLKIRGSQTLTERLATVEDVLSRPVAERVSQETAGFLKIWLADDVFAAVAVSKPEFMNAVENHIHASDPMSFSNRQWRVVYATLLATDPRRPQGITFVESMISSRENREKAIGILLAASTIENSDLSAYFESPTIRTEFKKILQLASQDVAKQRLVSLLEGVQKKNPEDPIFGDADLRSVFNHAHAEDLKQRRKPQPASPLSVIKRSCHTLFELVSRVSPTKRQ